MQCSLFHYSSTTDFRLLIYFLVVFRICNCKDNIIIVFVSVLKKITEVRID